MVFADEPGVTTTRTHSFEPGFAGATPQRQ
jgi:hypothetical protein